MKSMKERLVIFILKECLQEKKKTSISISIIQYNIKYTI